MPFFAGVVAAMGQAPFGLAIGMLIGLVLVFRVARTAPTPRSAAVIGFSFGFAYFAVSLHWIISPFLVDAARHGWMAPFAVILMAAGGALFWAFAFWAMAKLRHFWFLPLCFAGVEMLRAYIFTGFPWASPAQVMVEVPAGQLLALIGPHGLNLVIAAIATAVVGLDTLPRKRDYVLMGVVLLPFLPVPLVWLPATVQTDHVLRLVQPNAPQADKWNPDKIGIFYDRQLAFTAAAPDPALGPPDAVIWPETAIPWNLTYAETILQEISAAALGKPVILGVQRTEDMRHYNSLIALGPQGDVTQLYDKHHLVPFGEYVPLGNFMARFGIYGLAPQNGAGFSAGERAALMDLGPLGRALPLICYEAVFAHDVGAAPERPDFIIHATNDAWFGTYAGPQQHLAQARMRSIEQGLPVARAANTGISAMIDPYGRMTNSLGMGQAGFIDAALPEAREQTLYSKTGDWLAIGLMLAFLLILGLTGRKNR